MAGGAGVFVGSAVVSIVFALVVTAVTAIGGLVVTAASLWISWKIWQQLQGLRISVPVAVKTDSDAPALVKRTTCRACGSPKVKRSLSAYAYCDFCGELCDWDFQAALADKRSKLPGPTYEALLRQNGPKLTAARDQGDRAAYTALQSDLFGAYATACPAALSPRIGDPRYRERWLAFTAAHTTACDFDPECRAARAAQDAATAALRWDQSNPFAPKVMPATFWPLLDAVTAYQHCAAEIAVRDGLLERHPDRPPEELFERMGASAMAQGWLPFLTKADGDAMVAKLGLGGEYVRPEPVPMKSGPCPSCGAGLEVVEGAHRVVCLHCGHLAGLGGATLPCHGCGSPVQLPTDGQLFACPACSAELRMMRWS